MEEDRSKNEYPYTCAACGYRYKTKELAEQCETWCRERQSCNLEITAQGIPPAEKQ